MVLPLFPLSFTQRWVIIIVKGRGRAGEGRERERERERDPYLSHSDSERVLLWY